MEKLEQGGDVIIFAFHETFHMERGAMRRLCLSSSEALRNVVGLGMRHESGFGQGKGFIPFFPHLLQ